MFNKNKKKLKYIREAWAKPVERFRNLDLISFYHNAVSNSGAREVVDDKTWKDLDMDKFFASMDRTTSSIGQQYLFNILKNYENDAAVLNKRLNLFTHMRGNAETRENLQLKLEGLNNTKSYFITSLIFGKLPERPVFYFLIYLLPLVMLLSLFLIPFNNQFLLFAIAIGVINIIVEQVYSKNFYRYYSGFSALNNLLNCAISISGMKGARELPQTGFLLKNRHILRRLRKKIGFLAVDRSGGNDFIRMAIEYLNLVFLYDLVAFLRALKYLESQKSIIQDTFESLAELDAAISVASFLEEIPYYSVPEFKENKAITLDQVYHPLIPDAVNNSISDIDKSVLITGSNMAGKTTFIKTVGINFILAQTLNICLAKKAVIPRLIVKSAIRREDNLEESKSYYFVEIERLLSFIELCNNGLKYLFLIDEIFRGTNTVERLSSSTAVLRYLNKNNFSFVTTHDIELQELLGNTYRIFHFSEQVADHKFYFDYKIKEGTTFSGNAIKLLVLKGYPAEIIKDAGSVKNLLLDKDT